MRFVVVFMLAVFATVLHAAEELTEQDEKISDDARIVEYENNEAITTDGADKAMPQELQERPVRMIVGGESEDGVARKIIVAPR